MTQTPFNCLVQYAGEHGILMFSKIRHFLQFLTDFWRKVSFLSGSLSSFFTAIFQNSVFSHFSDWSHWLELNIFCPRNKMVNLRSKKTQLFCNHWTPRYKTPITFKWLLRKISSFAPRKISKLSKLWNTHTTLDWQRGTTFLSLDYLQVTNSVWPKNLCREQCKISRGH